MTHARAVLAGILAGGTVAILTRADLGPGEALTAAASLVVGIVVLIVGWPPRGRR